MHSEPHFSSLGFVCSFLSYFISDAQSVIEQAVATRLGMSVIRVRLRSHGTSLLTQCDPSKGDDYAHYMNSLTSLVLCPWVCDIFECYLYSR